MVATASRLLRFASIGSAASLLIWAAPAASETVTFEEKAAFYCEGGPSSSGGLTYTFGFAACYYSPSNPADFPTTPTSTVMANGYEPITFTLTGGGSFNVSTLDLAFGPWDHNGVSSDTILVSALLAGGGTLNTSFTIGFPFETYALNWNDLLSLTFSAPVETSAYVAFDNINYSVGGAVPEPSTWAMMLLGFGAIGHSMRRRRTRHGILQVA